MTETLTLRRAEARDIPALDDLFQRSYMALLKDDYAPSVLVTAVPVIGRAQPALIASGLFHVVEAGGRIAAAGGWSLAAPGGAPGRRGVGHVRHVATDPAMLRRGAARMVLDHIKIEAKASGMAQLHCQSTLTAEPFYAAMGFDTRGPVTIGLRGGIDFPAVFMVAQL
ncbi:GNAT family N-acetyltransferase [Thalassococcus sp. CAU 1522]|uniref:GNAT family N-acetyltransferase n=1 Tax=Thalassococcus arenae TaxID=2851652 RepID=A0ABS6N2S7_9RHOB|nr:GNAT family N-acetyltransferase [Thalassococcus arenae]MBV2358313.1 GNAT family N-acetyltransferase [Thalassococcus arenae]